MNTVIADPSIRKNPFDLVADSFLQEEGLPFARVLSAEDIQQAFAQGNALFAQEDIYSTQVVLWAFLAQVLRDGKGAACASAVADIALYTQQSGKVVPSGDTGDYCRARAKLDPRALRRLVAQTARDLEAQAKDAWLWHGRHCKLVDGFTFTLPDTPANQKAFPQMKSQKPGVGFPIARACAVLSLATGAIHDLGVGPYQGKETGESALLREIMDCLDKGDVAVLDRFFCSFMVLAAMKLRGVDVCTRLHQARHSDFRRGKRLGDHDLDRPGGLPQGRSRRAVRLPVERRVGHPANQADAAAGPRPLQEPGNGRAGTMDDPAGAQPDPQGDRHGRHPSPQATPRVGLHAGLPDDPVLLDAPGHRRLPRRQRIVGLGTETNRRQRSGQPPRTNRTSRPQTTPTPLPPDDPLTPKTPTKPMHRTNGHLTTAVPFGTVTMFSCPSFLGVLYLENQVTVPSF